jgi:hypothetical protein
MKIICQKKKDKILIIANVPIETYNKPHSNKEIGRDKNSQAHQTNEELQKLFFDGISRNQKV